MSPSVELPIHVSQNINAADRSKHSAELVKLIHKGNWYLTRSTERQITGAEELLKQNQPFSQEQKNTLNSLISQGRSILEQIKAFETTSAAAYKKAEELAFLANQKFKAGEYRAAVQLADSTDKILQSISKEASFLTRTISQSNKNEALLATQGIFVTDRYKVEEPNATIQVLNSYLTSSLKIPLFLSSRVVSNPVNSLRVIRDLSIIAAWFEPTGTGAGVALGFTVTGQTTAYLPPSVSPPRPWELVR